MTIRKVRCWLLAIGATCSPQMYGAAKPRLLWELKFSAILAGGPSESKNLQVRDLAYSPDGNWIAAVDGFLNSGLAFEAIAKKDGVVGMTDPSQFFNALHAQFGIADLASPTNANYTTDMLKVLDSVSQRLDCP